MNKKIKRVFAVGLTVALAASVLAGCGSDNGGGSADEGGSGVSSTDIYTLTREEGSGTRSAFVELFGIQEGDVDNTTSSAEITNSTSVMMTTVAGNESAIGYISLGSLDDSVKAVKINGAEATVDNIKSGSYKVSRPFNIVYKEDGLSEVGQDFVKFIMSQEGQAVIEEEGYISEGNEGAFAGTQPSGTITVAGSSSVSPVMEKLKEAYAEVNPNATVEVQQNDSSTGISSTASGVCDIGMASRELKDEEASQGLTPLTIAMDGIAVIVNKGNPLEELTSDQVKSIFTGEVTGWSDIIK